ncbi:integrator complex subunit 9-like [Ylistrum balloti]|uniref:integrator complex subunit 9-like n=1 Tax=Ylistrum balloti TaxID=509963 RepID=UPI002905AE1E|nr:integrator complex subunit 9-like [Ylistrum balloti]
MKLTCLSANPSKPCFILHFKGVTFMLDCGLDVREILKFLPLPVVHNARLSNLKGWTSSEDKSEENVLLEQELKQCGGNVFVDGMIEFSIPEVSITDLSQIDAILISNHNTILALPYITEYTGFKGIVYCTDPTLQIGRQYMEELVTYIERTPKSKVCTQWKADHILKSLPPLLRDTVRPRMWKKCYTRHDVNSSLARVQVVGYNERRDIYGSLTVLACSSGYSIGSCNWVISSEYEKICYVAGTSTLTTHPKPVDQAPLRNSDLLILGCLTQTPTVNPDAMIGEFCVNAAVTLKNGGNVLVPCYPSGITYDLFECLSGHLDTCGLSTIPMYFMSPVSDSVLAFSNIFAEWLSTVKQSRVYLPEPPFPHAELVTLGRLKHFNNIHDGLNTDFKTPCIVFTGHPSLRMGDVVHFIEMWGKSSGNTIIFTEPDFPYLEALAPYQPMQMRVCYCPIDTSLNYGQANKLIKDLKPTHLVVAENYTHPPVSMPHRTEFVIEWEPGPLTYKRGEVVSLPIKRQFESVELSSELAASLEPSEVKPGTSLCMVTASLVVKDNKYLLKPLSSESLSIKRRADGSLIRPKSYIWGKLNIQSFVDALTKQGITDIKVENIGEDGSIIHLSNDDTLIQVESDSTHIICEGEEAVRTKLRDTLLKCLHKL